MAVKDSLNFTLLTYAAYKNDVNCFKVVFEYVWKYKKYAEAVKKWLDMPTVDSNTALHYATQNGNLTMLSLLVEKGGADVNIRNKYGASVMHIAA